MPVYFWIAAVVLFFCTIFQGCGWDVSIDQPYAYTSEFGTRVYGDPDKIPEKVWYDSAQRVFSSRFLGTYYTDSAGRVHNDPRTIFEHVHHSFEDPDTAWAMCVDRRACAVKRANENRINIVSPNGDDAKHCPRAVFHEWAHGALWELGNNRNHHKIKPIFSEYDWGLVGYMKRRFTQCVTP